VEEVAATPFRKPNPVPRRHIEIAETGVPGDLERFIGILVADKLELVAQRHASKTELARQRVAPTPSVHRSKHHHDLAIRFIELSARIG